MLEEAMKYCNKEGIDNEIAGKVLEEFGNPGFGDEDDWCRMAFILATKIALDTQSEEERTKIKGIEAAIIEIIEVQGQLEDAINGKNYHEAADIKAYLTGLYKGISIIEENNKERFSADKIKELII